jgi:hypothetical protein
MLGSAILATDRASCRVASRWPGYAEVSTLTATGRPRTVSYARHTSDIPPSPMRRSMVKRPWMRRPGVNGDMLSSLPLCPNGSTAGRRRGPTAVLCSTRSDASRRNLRLRVTTW